MGTEDQKDNKMQNDQAAESVSVQENASDDRNDQTDYQSSRIVELELKLKQCQNALTASNKKVLTKEKEKIELEKELKTQAKLLDMEYQLEHEQDISENKLVTKKLDKLLKENEDQKAKISSLCEGLKKLESDVGSDIPTTKEQITENFKALKVAQLLLQQKCFDMQKSDEMNTELNIRLELEHDRRLRAQTEIGEIEKERINLQNDLETKNSECVTKSQEYDEVKMGCDFKINKYTAEIKKLEAKLEKIQLEKDKKIFELQSRNTELYIKFDSLEESYNNQMEISKTLQNELQSSFVESQSLIKEMEMLNLMFAEVEQHIFSNETKTMNDGEKVEVTQDGTQVEVDEVLKVAQSREPSQSLFQQSCFNEVSTKNGTKMVLSVSKTFLKLKDLILEKNTLEEQMTKMRKVNLTLCSHVNLHEEKLCSITDELNNTWFYVSKIKEQHKKMHSSEQILRAELAEKRQLLKNIRKELEESRTSMDLVKQMNAESEKQWLQLKVDFAERKRSLMSSSESGFSEVDSEDKTESTDDIASIVGIATQSDAIMQNSDTIAIPGQSLSVHELVSFDDDTDSEEIPDPFSDDEEENKDTLEKFFLPMVTSVGTLINDEDDDEIETFDDEEEREQGFTSIFVPSMSYLAQVPASMQPDLLASEKDFSKLDSEHACRDKVDEDVLEEVDDSVRDLINRLSSSTARGAFLANRLSDIHRRIATGTSLTDHNDWFDEEDEQTETDIEPRDTDYDDELTVPSPDLESEIIDEVAENNQLNPLDLPTTSTPYGERDFDDSRPASTDSMVLAIDEAINILDPVSLGQIPLAPPQPTYSLLPPSIGMIVRPNFNQTNDGENENDDDRVENEEDPVQSTDNSTAVTRYLIKHLPKQLTQLRNEKLALEDKIHDFEQIVSEQRMQMSEHERRVEVERSKTQKMEERLKKVEEKLPSETEQNTNIPVTFTVPVEVDQENMLLNWTVESKSERACGYWMSFVTAGATDSDAVILPNMVREVIPMDLGITTSLQVECAFKGKYTLHIQGSGTKMPQVSVNLSPIVNTDQKLQN
eukprot:GFUD01005181.1.p1 GENE.GFUD01005181.1~~GFUD01005181.1.p1  ORF type:complete len:1051 (+),score=335.48 GFUD01005181.1:44-3196(+)